MKDIPEGYELVNDIPQGYELATTPEIMPDYGFQGQMRKRGARFADILQGAEGYGASNLERLYQGGMNIVGTGADVLGAAVEPALKAGYKLLPESGQQYLQQLGRNIAPIAQAMDENYTAYALKNPRVAANFEATRELANLMPLKFQPIQGMLSRVGKPISSAIKNVGTDSATVIKDIVNSSIIPDADQIRAIARQDYDFAESMGANLSPDFTNTLINNSSKILPTDPYSRIGRGKTISDQFVEELASFKDKPMTLANAEAFDQNLTNKIASTWDVSKGRYSEAGQELRKLQDDFRDMVENPKEGWVASGKDSLDAYRRATSTWAAARRMDDIEDIFKRAEMMDNPATGIKTGFRTLAMNKKRMRGYTEQERKLIENAAKSGVATDLLRTFGSRLIPIFTGAAGGGLGATAGAAAGSMASRGLATKMQVRRGEKVAKEIAKRVPKQANKPKEK